MPNTLKHPRNVFSLVTCVDQNFEAIGALKQASQVFRRNIGFLDSLINNVSAKLGQGTEATVALHHHIFAGVVLKLPDDNAIHQ